ncbi:Protein of unknown function [Salipaludibacillus aurantiacus]|uniref:DUF3896 domain-containing protein n=2 Tax=Salipaludibacillus aurantiacus TaxID=1601833 RepID=A0A1H9Q7M3_9BACI|nr:Protein of unknown function [Salipaludibacillus aurantiacus]
MQKDERVMEMEYQKAKEKLESLKAELVGQMNNPALSEEEKQIIQKSIDNYDYIIELTDMNHYYRGPNVH